MIQTFWDAQTAVIGQQTQALEAAKTQFPAYTAYFAACQSENTASASLTMSDQNYTHRSAMLQQHDAALRTITLSYRLQDLLYNTEEFHIGNLLYILAGKAPLLAGSP